MPRVLPGSPKPRTVRDRCGAGRNGGGVIAAGRKAHAPVAQLDRALASEAKGSAFDSRRAYFTRFLRSVSRTVSPVKRCRGRGAVDRVRPVLSRCAGCALRAGPVPASPPPSRVRLAVTPLNPKRSTATVASGVQVLIAPPATRDRPQAAPTPHPAGASRGAWSPRRGWPISAHRRAGVPGRGRSAMIGAGVRSAAAGFRRTNPRRVDGV